MRKLSGMGAWAAALALGAALEAAEPADGKSIFVSKCALCHGKNGTPQPAFAKKGVRNLGDPEWQKSRTDEQIRKSILNGRPGTMMASFEGAFTPEELAALVKFVRSLGAARESQ